jgi:hypothetical protein
MITEGGHAKIMDFGLVRRLTGVNSPGQELMGTVPACHPSRREENS